MGGQPMWSNKKNEYMSKKSEKLRVKKLSTSIKTSSSQPTVSVSTYTVVDEMAQAFLPMVTVLDFTPAQPNPPVPTQAFTPVITVQAFSLPQLIPPVLTQAFTPVVTMQDVTQTQPKAP
jgi:hypothetical protein